MTVEQLRKTGEIALGREPGPLSDAELELAIKGLEHVIAFVHGGNDSWNLARFPLLRRLEELERCQSVRERSN